MFRLGWPSGEIGRFRKEQVVLKIRFRKPFVCAYNSSLEIFLSSLLKNGSFTCLHILPNYSLSLFSFTNSQNKFVQRDVLIHKFTVQEALCLRAHVAFEYITLPPGGTLPKPIKRTESVTCLLELEGGNLQ